MESIKQIIGKTMKRVENLDNNQLIFETTDGEIFRLFHDQDCCECVSIDDISGDLSFLVDYPILVAEESTSHENPEYVSKDFQDESFTWTFYKFATVRGWVDVRWYGESNGYYSESVDFEKVQ